MDKVSDLFPEGNDGFAICTLSPNSTIVTVWNSIFQTNYGT